MESLFACVGYDDPFTPGLVAGDEHPGPILALRRDRAFRRVILLVFPGMETAAEKMVEALHKEFPDTETEQLPLTINEATPFQDVVTDLKQEIRQIVEASPLERYAVLTNAFFPQVHGAWYSLRQSGWFRAQFYEVMPNPASPEDGPVILEIEPIESDIGGPLNEEPPTAAEDDQALFEEDVIRQVGVVGNHARLRKALNISVSLARHAAPVLLQGETGTGKQIFARLIHRLSPRSRKPLLVVNCAAVPEALIESVLFGHRKGAFSGATTRQIGKFELAHGGTLFLDELNALSLRVQAKLLKVIQSGTIEPLGEAKSTRVDVRVIAATNIDLEQSVMHGDFREDLYFRLRVGAVDLPPLRERRADIPKLALHMLGRINKALRKPKRLSKEALEYLELQEWPGNIRELQSVIERAALLCDHDVIDVDDLQAEGRTRDVVSTEEVDLPLLSEGFSMETYLGELRRRLLYKALADADGNQSVAARKLGITPQAVHKFLKGQKRPLSEQTEAPRRKRGRKPRKQVD